jgi:hypothetical protein
MPDRPPIAPLPLANMKVSPEREVNVNSPSAQGELASPAVAVGSAGLSRRGDSAVAPCGRSNRDFLTGSAGRTRGAGHALLEGIKAAVRSAALDGFCAPRRSRGCIGAQHEGGQQDGCHGERAHEVPPQSSPTHPTKRYGLTERVQRRYNFVNSEGLPCARPRQSFQRPWGP